VIIENSLAKDRFARMHTVGLEGRSDEVLAKQFMADDVILPGKCGHELA
jgi:hypothetical protein